MSDSSLAIQNKMKDNKCQLVYKSLKKSFTPTLNKSTFFGINGVRELAICLTKSYTATNKVLHQGLENSLFLV